MGSVGNQNPWSPYDTYKDCSLGICSIYCPQYCYFIFPPPPPTDTDSSSPFSPLIIAIIGILASAFLLISYYTIVTRYCKRSGTQNAAEENHHDELGDHQWQQAASNGLDEAIIKTITVCNYQKGEGLIEGTECAVCLTEFQENESLRLLPKCSHAFHLPCIDTWLKSQSSCPLCRANVTPLPHPSPPNAQTSYGDHNHNVDSYQVQRPNDLILVVDDHELVGNNDDDLKSPVQNAEERQGSDESGQESVHKFRRSASLGAFPFERRLLISDVIKIKEIDVDLQSEKDQDIGSSMKRSHSTGGSMFMDHNKGKSSILPH